jgi:hypothetical protein
VLAEYLADDVPTVRLRDGLVNPGAAASERGETTSEPGETEWATRLMRFLGDFVRRSEGSAAASWDQHYIYAVVGNLVLFLGEQAYLILLLAVVSSPVIYGLAFRQRLFRYVKLVGRSFWSLLVLLGFMFLFLFIATALIRGILDFRSFPTLWHFAPGPYFLLKLLISVFLFAIVFQSLRRLPFPRLGSFYSASAILLLFFDVLLLSFFDISFTFYFLWGFIFAFFFSLARWPWLKTVFLLLAPLWMVIGAVEIFSSDELAAAEALLLSPVSGNLIFAFVVLPFLLMLIRVDLILHRRWSFPHGSTMRVTVLGSAAAAVLFASALVFLEPYSEEHPQPVNAVQLVDADNGTHRLLLSSPAPMDGLTVERGGATFVVDGDERNRSFELPGMPEPVTLTLESRDFLSRSRRTLTVDSRLPPREVRVRLETEEELLLYDSRFPAVVSQAQSAARFAIGPYPPNPLEVGFTVGQDTPTRLGVEVISSGTETPMWSDSPGFELHPSTRVVYPVGE